METLERRLLLAGDIAAWQNPILPADVNGDGVVAPDDLLFVAHEIFQNGSRQLTGDASGSDDGPASFFDVNGDGFLTPDDAHVIAMGMDGGGTTQVMQLRFEVTDASGTSIDTASINDDVQLNVMVQDIRPAETPSRGVTAAFLNVIYDAPFVSLAGAKTFGDEYGLLPDQSVNSIPGEITDLGNSVTDFGLGGPLGPDEFLLVTVPFTVDAAPVTANDDDATTNGLLDVSEDGPAATVNVVANDVLGGSTLWRGEPASTPIFTDSFLFDDVQNPVPTENIIYGTDSLVINGTGPLVVSGLDLTNTLGDVTDNGDGTVTYDPNGQFESLREGVTMTDTFEYTINSGTASDTATVRVTITGVNDSPTANDDFETALMTPENQAVVTPNVLTNDTDPESDELSVLSINLTGTLGSVTNNSNGTFTYNPNGQFDDLAEGQSDTDSFEYTVSDGNGGTDMATVTIVVTGVGAGANTPPDAIDDSGFGFITDEDTSFTTGDVLDNDEDDDVLDVLSVIALDDSATTGLVVDNGNGTFDYDPDGKFESLGVGKNATDTFNYTVTDGRGGIDTATVTIRIDGVNDSPTANDDFDVPLMVATDMTLLTPNVLDNDTDPDDDDMLSVVSIDTTATTGEVTNHEDGTFTYDPNGQFDSLSAGESDTDSFQYMITDGNGGTSSATVTITVNGVGGNTRPDAMDDSGVDFMTDEDTAFTTANVLDNDEDDDVGDILFVMSFDDSSTLGIVSDNGDGTFDYDPDGQFESLGSGKRGSDSFIYTVSDGNGGTDTATVTITIDGVNDDPTANPDAGLGYSTDQNTPFTTPNVILSNDTDPDDDMLSVLSIDDSSTLGLVTSNGDGTFDYDPNGRFGGLGPGDSTTDSFSYTITDGNGGESSSTVTITVRSETTFQVLVRLETANLQGTPISEVVQGSQFQLNVYVQDIRAGTLPAERGVFKSFVDVTFDASIVMAVGPFTYGAAYQEENSGNIATPGLVDEAGGTQTGFGFEPPFDGPLGPDERLLFSLPFDATELGLFTFFSLSADPAQSHEITLFQPPNDVEPENVDFGDTTFTVIPPNVVANPDSGVDFTTDEDTAFTTGNVLDNDDDLDSDPLMVARFDIMGTTGIVVSNGDGTFDYDPDGQFNFLRLGEQTTDSFTYTATDGESTPGHESTTTVTVTITGVNDVPLANPDSGAGFMTDEDTAFTTPSVLTNDFDAEGDDLTVIGCDGATGMVTCNADGTIDYDPNGQFEFLGVGDSIVDTFDYFLFDGLATSTGTVMIVIEGRNDAPMANDDFGVGYSTSENTPFTTGNVLTNDDDVDGDPLSVVDFDVFGTLGTVTNNGNGTFDYDPNGRFDSLPVGDTATDTFTYTISDGQAESTATVTIEIVAALQVAFRLETTDLNGVPISEVMQFDPFLINVYVQDVRLASVPNRGVFQAHLDVTFDATRGMATGPFTFGANYLEETAGSIALGLIDEGGGTQTGFGLDPIVVGPLGADEILLFSVGMEATIVGTWPFASNRADLADIHDVTLFAPPVSVDPDDITYGTTSILITPAPVVSNPDGGADFTTDEDTPFTTGNVLDNDIDREADPLFVSAFDITGTIGIVTNNGDGTFDYDPNSQFEFLKPGESATDTFTYTATDGDPSHLDSSTVTITITGVNDSPVAVDDSGIGFTTDELTPFTTDSLLDNDTDIEGDSLFLVACDATAAAGQVTCNSDGTIDYDPNGQFDFLLVGDIATDTITYIMTDGNGGFDEGTVTIMISSASAGPGSISGFVYADVSHDGVKDAVERNIGDVEIRLEGTDVFGNPVSRSTRTDSLGAFGFVDVIAGIYELFEVQPMFFVDGIDTVNGAVHTGTNDRISLDTSNLNSPQFDVLFGERSLHPDFISIEDFINTELRKGIVIGYDAAGNQLWHSLMDGWEGVTAVEATFSGGGTTAHLTVTLATGGQMSYTVPTDRTANFFRVKGETGEGRVVQFIGTMGDFQSLLTASIVDATFAELGV